MAAVAVGIPEGFEVEQPSGGLPDGFSIEPPAGRPTPMQGIQNRLAQLRGEPVTAPYGDVPPDDLGRQVGLTARAAINGITGIPQIIGNAANAATNLGIRGVNAVAGTHIPQLGTVSNALDRGMTQIGLPEPRGRVEQGVQVAGSALAGAGTAKAATLSEQVMKVIPETARRIANELANGPISQTLGAGGSYLAATQAQDMGVKDPTTLGLIGMVGGGLAGSPVTAGGRLAAGGAQAVRPFTTAGRDVLVGRLYNRMATNPGMAASQMENAAELIPGSQPTVSQVSRDPGLINMESALKGMDENGSIAARQAQQNLARQNALYGIAGDEASITAAKARQKAAYDELGAPAFKNSTPINIGRTTDDNPVLETIAMIRNSPAGARKTVQQAMDHAEEQLTQPGVDITDAATLYEIRKDLALARDGKLTGTGGQGIELSNLKNAKSQLGKVIDSLDDVIDSGAPGYKDYLSEFHQRSIPLDQLKALQTIRQRAELAVSDQSTQTPILGNKFITLLRNNLDSGLNLRGRGPKAGNLSADQLDMLSRIAADMDRGSAAQAGTMRSPGSDTFKNMSVASVIGRVLGDETGEFAMQTAAGKTLARPLNFLYRVPDQEIQHLMLQSWLDPKLAASLMRKANQADIENIASVLKRKAAENAIGAAAYGERP